MIDVRNITGVQRQGPERRHHVLFTVSVLLPACPASLLVASILLAGAEPASVITVLHTPLYTQAQRQQQTYVELPKSSACSECFSLTHLILP